MSKIAIISQAELGVLIDISGCSGVAEAKQYLTSTLQVSSQFWDGLKVDLNLGPLVLSPEEISEIQEIVNSVGVNPRQIFSLSPITKTSLLQNKLPVADSFTDKFSPQTADETETDSISSEALNKKEQTKELAQANNSMSITCSGFSQSRIVQNKIEEIQKSQLAQVALGKNTNKNFDYQMFDLDLESNYINSWENEKLENIPNLEIYNKKNKKKDEPKQSTSKIQEKQPAIMYLRQTLRSGQSVSHKGHLVIIGDVNPGAEIMAEGDITVWGCLRGMAHAGTGGNTNAEIRALRFEPIQLRIAHAIARSPDRTKNTNISSSGPETARIIDGKIRISVTETD